MTDAGTIPRYTIICGNPVEGFELYGLFLTELAALEYANADAHLPDTWQIMRIHSVPIVSGNAAPAVHQAILNAQKGDEQAFPRGKPIDNDGGGDRKQPPVAQLRQPHPVSGTHLR